MNSHGVNTNGNAASPIDTYLAPGGRQEELIAQFSQVVKGFHGRAVLRGPDGAETPIPDEIFAILKRAASELQRGRGVTVVPSDQLLTTQEGAELLGVSRPTLIKLLEGGQIPFDKVGRHRRIALRDLLDYRERHRERRLTALREIAATTQHTETFYRAGGKSEGDSED